ncbi:MAG: Gfo/Idh/MocA family oxidoreductase [Myxococcota bacterium]|nr:Gfo/Idh/MocA family oxidoreductase [Myxococcota bacterium]
MSDAPLRFGILGAARIAPMALVRPARQVEGAQVVAVAARDPDRARRFATRHGVPRVHGSYAALLADPEVDAVYNPLPNALHAEWTVRALEAGKHVLCEKPLASNAAEAARMADAARAAGRRLVEAFHWRYHPLAARMLAIVAGGELGPVRHLETELVIPLVLPRDIRWRLDLAGGATMDVGCYTIHMLRSLAGAEPEVVSARARELGAGVDRTMDAELRFADGRTGRIRCGLLSARIFRARARVVGERATLEVTNPLAPHFFHRLRVRSTAGARRERVPGRATYVHQLEAFVDAVRAGTPLPTDPADAVANMRVIDAVYDAAGLARRGA